MSQSREKLTILPFRKTHAQIGLVCDITSSSIYIHESGYSSNSVSHCEQHRWTGRLIATWWPHGRRDASTMSSHTVHMIRPEPGFGRWRCRFFKTNYFHHCRYRVLPRAGLLLCRLLIALSSPSLGESVFKRGFHSSHKRAEPPLGLTVGNRPKPEVFYHQKASGVEAEIGAK